MQKVTSAAALSLAFILPFAGGMLGCGKPPDPQEVLRQQAAASFEPLDAKYLDRAHSAIEQADPLVPTAYELSLHALAVANSDFIQGLETIPMPDDSRGDAQALVDDAKQLLQGAVACEALIASGSVCQASAVNDWIHTRNAADRKLRMDLHLDPSKVPD